MPVLSAAPCRAARRRRAWPAVALAIGQGSAPATIAGEAARPRAEWGAAIGDVTADRALVWSRADRTARMLVEMVDRRGLAQPDPAARPAATEATRLHRARSTCRPAGGCRIFYRVSFAGPDADAPLSAPVQGRFRTAPASRRDLRFLWSGDTAGQGWGINRDLGGMPHLRGHAPRPTPTSSSIAATPSTPTGRSRPSVTLPDGRPGPTS